MTVNFDWVAIVEKAGIAGICLAIIYFGFKLFELFMHQWKSSTDAVNKNTEAFTKLSSVFEKSHEREMQFQKEAIELLQDNNALNRDTNRRVRELQEKI